MKLSTQVKQNDETENADNRITKFGWIPNCVIS